MRMYSCAAAAAINPNNSGDYVLIVDDYVRT